MYACIAATEDNNRCEFPAEEIGRFCSFHRECWAEGGNVRMAPEPAIILIKCGVNPAWTEKLQKAGIPSGRSELKKQEDVQQDVQRRPGVAVFGEDGATNVSLWTVLKELRQEDYNITNIHLRWRYGKGTMSTLVIGLARNGESITVPAREHLYSLLSSCWGKCRVWANPPTKDGVIHTVNASHRCSDKKPENLLHFARGLWLLEPVV